MPVGSRLQWTSVKVVAKKLHQVDPGYVGRGSVSNCIRVFQFRVARTENDRR